MLNNIQCLVYIKNVALTLNVEYIADLCDVPYICFLLSNLKFDSF